MEAKAARTSHLLLEDDPDATDPNAVYVVCSNSPKRIQVRLLRAIIDAEPLVMMSTIKRERRGLVNIVTTPVDGNARALLVKLQALLEPEYPISLICYVCSLEGESPSVGIALRFITPVTDADYNRLRALITTRFSQYAGRPATMVWQAPRVFLLRMPGVEAGWASDLAHDVAVVEANAHFCSLVHIYAEGSDGTGMSTVTLRTFIERIVEDGDR